MIKGYLVLALDNRGHFVIAKAFTNHSRSLDYEAFLNNNISRPMGDEMRYIEDIEVFKIEIDNL